MVLYIIVNSILLKQALKFASEMNGDLMRISDQVTQIFGPMSSNIFSALIILVVGWIVALIVSSLIGKALRREVPMYPDLAVRELIANALIHQDFSITGAGPMVEVFADRMEITNPSRPPAVMPKTEDAAPAAARPTSTAGWQSAAPQGSANVQRLNKSWSQPTSVSLAAEVDLAKIFQPEPRHR